MNSKAYTALIAAGLLTALGLLALAGYLAYTGYRAHDVITSYVDKRVFGVGGAASARTDAPLAYGLGSSPKRSPAPSAPPHVVQPSQSADTPVLLAPAPLEPIEVSAVRLPDAYEDDAEPTSAYRFGSPPTGTPGGYGGWQTLPKAPSGMGGPYAPSVELRPPAKSQSVPAPGGGLLLAPGLLMVLLRLRWVR